MSAVHGVSSLESKQLLTSPACRSVNGALQEYLRAVSNFVSYELPSGLTSESKHSRNVLGG